MRRANLPFFRNGFVEIYFSPISGHQFQTVLLVVMQQCGKDCVTIGESSTTVEILSCDIDLVDGAQCKCKHNVDLCFTLSYELVERLPNINPWKFFTAHILGR